MLIGRCLDSEERVDVEFRTSRRVLVCGKTGSGKSYTLGVLIEEFGYDANTICLVVDPQGIYWTMGQPNIAQERDVYEWGLVPRGIRVNLLVPGNPVDRYGGQDVLEAITSRNVDVRELRVNPADLSEEMWCDLFGLSINELQGARLFKSVRNCRRELGRDFLIPDIIRQVEVSDSLDTTKEALYRKLEMALDWGIFQEVRYTELWEMFDYQGVNVLDLSTVDQTRYGLRNLIVAVLARFLFRERTVARRREELGMGSEMPKVCLIIDEAHNFCPAGKSTLSKEVLIRWAKEGRQPGLSLLVASQQPGAIDSEILTQCDLTIVHKLTNREDRRAISALSEDYVNDRVHTEITKLSNIGQAIMVDDNRESVQTISVRPRLSQHGGGSR
ncbi:MAG: ATP-binding protein [Bacillota bacterium]